MYLRTSARRRVARRSAGRSKVQWVWTNFEAQALGPISVAAPITNDLVVSNIQTDSGALPRGMVIERIVGMISVQPQVAPAALTAGMLVVGFSGPEPAGPLAAASFDLNTTLGRSKSWMWQYKFGYDFVAAPVAGAYAPTGTAEFDIRVRRKLRSTDDRIYFTAQVLGAACTQTWLASMHARILVRVP